MSDEDANNMKRRMNRVVGKLEDAGVRVKSWNCRVPPSIRLCDNASTRLVNKAAKVAHLVYPHEIFFESWTLLAYSRHPK